MFALISRITYYISTLSNVAGTLVVLGLVALVNFDVVARGVFHAPFLGTVELVQFSMVLIVFLQLPDVVRVNRLTRSDGFLVILGKKAPAITALIRRVVDGVSGVLMLLIALAIWPQFIEMWESRDYFGVPGVFTAPWWPIKLAILLSTGLCAFIFAMKALVPASLMPLLHPASGGSNTSDKPRQKRNLGDHDGTA